MEKCPQYIISKNIADNSQKGVETQDEWINKMWSTHIMPYYLALKWKEILTHPINKGEPWGYAKWNKLIKKGKMLYDSTYVGS